MLPLRSYAAFIKWIDEVSSMWATAALLGNAAASPHFSQNEAAGGWLSAHLCQADTEKKTVNQLTLHFLGRHEWEITIAASAAYNAPQTNTFFLSLSHMLSENESLLHCSSDHSLDIFSYLLSIYQSSYRKDASLTFPKLWWCRSKQKQQINMCIFSAVLIETHNRKVFPHRFPLWGEFSNWATTFFSSPLTPCYL